MKIFMLILLSIFSFTTYEKEKALVLVGARICTTPGIPPIEEGIVIIKDGKIEEVGDKVSGRAILTAK